MTRRSDSLRRRIGDAALGLPLLAGGVLVMSRACVYAEAAGTARTGTALQSYPPFPLLALLAFATLAGLVVWALAMEDRHR